jgi:hypothetical protein
MHFNIVEKPSLLRQTSQPAFSRLKVNLNIFCGALQLKSLRESNINVWFPFMYSQNWNCSFQNRILMICLLEQNQNNLGNPNSSS